MKKKPLVILIFLVALYIPSIFNIIHTNVSIREMNKIKDNLQTVNLSNIKVPKHDGTGGFELRENEVFINDKRVKAVAEVLELLGNSCSTKVEKLSLYYDTYTYIDHKNNLELNVAELYEDKSKPYLEIKKINRKYNDEYISFNTIADNRLGLAWKGVVIAAYPKRVFSDSYINILSLIYMPLIYFVLFIPAMAAFLYKRHRKTNVLLQCLILIAVFVVAPMTILSVQ